MRTAHELVVLLLLLSSALRDAAAVDATVNATCEGGGLALTPALYEQGYEVYKEAACVPANFASNLNFKGDELNLTDMKQLVYVGGGALAGYTGNVVFAGSFPKLREVRDLAFITAGTGRSSFLLVGPTAAPALQYLGSRALQHFKGTVKISGPFPSFQYIGSYALQVAGNGSKNSDVHITCRGRDRWTVGTDAFDQFYGTHDPEGESIACDDTTPITTASTTAETTTTKDIFGPVQFHKKCAELGELDCGAALARFHIDCIWSESSITQCVPTKCHLLGDGIKCKQAAECTWDPMQVFLGNPGCFTTSTTLAVQTSTTVAELTSTSTTSTTATSATSATTAITATTAPTTSSTQTTSSPSSYPSFWDLANDAWDKDPHAWDKRTATTTTTTATTTTTTTTTTSTDAVVVQLAPEDRFMGTTLLEILSITCVSISVCVGFLCVAGKDRTRRWLQSSAAAKEGRSSTATTTTANPFYSHMLDMTDTDASERSLLSSEPSSEDDDPLLIPPSRPLFDLGSNVSDTIDMLVEPVSFSNAGRLLMQHVGVATAPTLFVPRLDCVSPSPSPTPRGYSSRPPVDFYPAVDAQPTTTPPLLEACGFRREALIGNGLSMIPGPEIFQGGLHSRPGQFVPMFSRFGRDSGGETSTTGSISPSSMSETSVSTSVSSASSSFEMVPRAPWQPPPPSSFSNENVVFRVEKKEVVENEESCDKNTCSKKGCPVKLTSWRHRHGRCVKHGIKATCSFVGCKTNARVRGLCAKHGAYGTCSAADCQSNAIVRGLCKRHGANGTCSAKDCTANAKLRGRCHKHGANGICSVAGCKTSAITRERGLCSKHGAQGVCSHPGCTTNARGGTGVCHSHLESADE